jgi:hypothetical protein
VSVSSNNLTRTASGDNWDNAGAASTQTLARGDGYVEFTAAQANKYLMCGLNNSDNDRSYAEIDFAIYLQDSGYIYRSISWGRMFTRRARVLTRLAMSSVSQSKARSEVQEERHGVLYERRFTNLSTAGRRHDLLKWWWSK